MGPEPDSPPADQRTISTLGGYIRHLRPLSFPVVALHLATGFVAAHGKAVPALGVMDWCALAASAGIWTVLLNGGTLALNSHFDTDEGDIGYLFNPPPKPPRLLAFSLALLTLGLALSALLGRRFLAAYGICLTMSLLYSIPPMRLKARAGWDLLINCSGYGALTIYAGWAAAQKSLTASAAFLCAGFFFLFMCLYPLTQIYQIEEDTRHGDRTLAVRLGRRRSLWLALTALCAGFALLAGYAATAPGGRKWRALGLAISLAAWAAVLAPWLVRREGYPEKRGMYRALWAWGLTNVAVALTAVLS